MREHERVLLIDTCGETAGVACSLADQILASEDLPPGTASADIIAAVRRALTRSRWHLRDLHAIGVVSGPGSFTGTRAGLATAKGLCVASHLPLAAVSRLKVLADAANLTDGFTVLDAGRREVYVRDVITDREWLCTADDLKAQCGKQRIALAEPRLNALLQGCTATLHTLHAADSLTTVRRCLRAGGNDVSLTDANYVRQEADIYRMPSVVIA